MATLTSAQVSQAVQYGFCFMLNGMGSTTTIMGAVDSAATAIGNRLNAIYNQVRIYFLTMFFRISEIKIEFLLPISYFLNLLYRDGSHSGFLPY